MAEQIGYAYEAGYQPLIGGPMELTVLNYRDIIATLQGTE